MSEQTPFKISGSLLARNTLLNFIGQVIPLVVGVITIPFIVRGLGTERFGLLSMAWVVLRYFAIFDLGLGRATTKFVAEALGRGEHDEIPRIVWTAVTVQAVLGILGTLVLAGITPLLVERVLKIPPELVGEAKATFYLLALSIPVVLVSGSFRGILEAAQRFDLVNAVKVPTSVLTFLLPLVGLLLGFRLPGIVMLILLTRLAALLAFIALNCRILTQPRRFSISSTLFPSLFAYGGWIMVTQIVNPILIYLDRFLIGSLLSMTAVTFYTAPYEVVTRLQIIPASLTMTLFPTFSALEGIEDRQKLGTLFTRSAKYILLSLGPIIIALVLFAKELLLIWLGTDFANKSAVVLQILALGVLINSLAYVPSTLLSGAGRPDIPAKVRLFELPIYLGIGWFLIQKHGIVGAAMAWTMRVALDALLLFGFAFRTYRIPARSLAGNGIVCGCFALIILASLAYGIKTFALIPFYGQVCIFIVLVASFGCLMWGRSLTTSERTLIRNILTRRRG